MSKGKLYLAHGYGFSEITYFSINNLVIPLIERSGYEVICPWKILPEEYVRKIRSMPYSKRMLRLNRELDKKIADSDLEAIVDKDTRGIIAILDGVPLDTGVASECASACDAGKKILGYRNDYRPIAESVSTPISLMVAKSVRDSGGKMIKTLRRMEYELKHGFFD